MQPKKRPILLYLAFTYALTKLLVILSLLGRAGVLYDSFGYMVMWCPGVAGMVVDRMACRSKTRLGLRVFGLKSSLLAAAVPIVYLGLSHLVYGLLFPGTFALALPKPGTLTASFPIHVFFALGEELGWRGLLAPALTNRYGFVRASFLTGLIWWAWHLSLGNPFIYESYSYPGATISFALNLIALSFVMNALQLRSQSVWPAALLHGTNNFLNGILDPSTWGDYKALLVGEAGLITLAATAFCAAVILIITELQKQPFLKHPQ